MILFSCKFFAAVLHEYNQKVNHDKVFLAQLGVIILPKSHSNPYLVVPPVQLFYMAKPYSLMGVAQGWSIKCLAWSQWMPLKVPHTRRFSKLPGGTEGSLHPLKLLLSLLCFCLWMFPQRNRPWNDPLMVVCPREISSGRSRKNRVDQKLETVMFPESLSRIPEASISSWFSEAQEKLGGECRKWEGSNTEGIPSPGGRDRRRHETSLCSAFVFRGQF